MAQTSLLETDELSKNFINAMRVLFRIMDDQNTGFIQYSDIELLWQDNGNEGLSRGILEALKEVTPPNGLISFDRFCAGLKICLLRIKNDLKLNHHTSHTNKLSTSTLIMDNQTKDLWTQSNTATIRPNNAILKRTFNSKSFGADLHKDFSHVPLDTSDERLAAESKLINVRGPPKPPRTNVMEKRSIKTENSFEKLDVKTAQNWQLGLMSTDDKCSMKVSKPNYNSNSRTLLKTQKAVSDDKGMNAQANQLEVSYKKSTSRGKEIRRHTLQNGIDYNMIKRIKQIEQEKDILCQGLAAVEKAREWYLKQIASTQEKMKHLGSMTSYEEQWTEAQAERLELQRARVLEVNRYLAALTTSWERGGLPLHMNLAFLNTSNPVRNNQNAYSQLQHQNYRLTEELNKKTHKIALLEEEKENLIRELYNRQAGMIQSRRSTMIHEQHDQTFM
ncbi:suppressor APC domain-containing protein 2 isoform X2 [Chelonus insularis]|uniref:suppressor APC domain-containing protein 2 isoform X2 n=1 Tax=Chelonus insularis TaxID=460826 RepID=UPI00158F3E31|nr:suppressor APC domain-containing protein 2 isoform X2 [Chelonus insularis]